MIHDEDPQISNNESSQKPCQAAFLGLKISAKQKQFTIKRFPSLILFVKKII